MHIAEGILTIPVLASGYVVAIAGLTFSLKKLPEEQIPQVALLSAVFFIASLIHIPLGATQIHLVLHGLIGLLLGWAAFPALFIALLLQAVLFGFGGISTLGINTVNLALPALLAFYAGRGLMTVTQRGFLIGLGSATLAMLGSLLLIGGSLRMGGQEFWPLIQLMMVIHVPLLVIEGLITGLIVAFLQKVAPEILQPITQIPVSTQTTLNSVKSSTCS